MATKSGSVGITTGTKYTTFASPVSIGVTMSAGQYPNGELTIGLATNVAYWKNTHTSGNRSATLYLCDSEGKNKQTLFGIVLGGGGTNTTLKSATISNATGLTGKALYFVMTGDTDYIRLWGQATVTVTYSNRSYTLAKASSPSAGGSVTLGATSATYNTKIKVSASANTGYSFSSWSKSAGTLSSTTTNPTTFTMPASNATVTGNFTANSYTLKSAVSPSGGGSVTLGASSGTYTQKINVSASASTGYTFSSWSKSAGTLSSTTTNPTTFTFSTSNATVTANFTHNTYSVGKAVSPSGGGSVTLSSSSGYYNDKINLTATASTGYTFSSWSKTSGTLSSTTSNPTTFTLPAGNSTVTATFVHNTYSVSSAVSPSGGGSVALSSSSGYYNDKIKITATASTGYTFSSWSKSGGTLDSTTANPTTFTLPAGNSTVTANFTHNTYSVAKAVSPSGGGSVTLSSSSGYYNDNIKLTATASTGYTFSSWSKSSGTLSSTTSNPTTFTLPAGNSTVTATFTHNTYSISKAVTPSGGGTVTLGATSGYYNDKVQIVATPSADYEFTGWTASSGTLTNASASTTTLTLSTADTTVTASFALLGYNVTTSVSPSGSGTLTASPSLAQAGATVTLTATPASGYIFENYTSNPSVTIANNTFAMPSSAVAITANFAPLTASTCTLDKNSYIGGDTAVLTINSASSSFSHKYKLDFGDSMSTGWVDVQAGVSSVNILVPVEWCLLLTSGTSKSGGTLTLETYYNGSSLGSNSVTNLTYVSLDNTIPAISVWRCDSSGVASIAGEYGKYSITVPQSISNYSLIYGQDSVSQPLATGDVLPNDKKSLALNSNHMLQLQMTYGSETFSIQKDIPKVVVITKLVLAQ